MKREDAIKLAEELTPLIREVYPSYDPVALEAARYFLAGNISRKEMFRVRDISIEEAKKHRYTWHPVEESQRMDYEGAYYAMMAVACTADLEFNLFQVKKYASSAKVQRCPLFSEIYNYSYWKSLKKNH
jgi:hypothetical protein